MSSFFLPQLIYAKYHWLTAYVSQVLQDSEWSDLNRSQLVIMGGIRNGISRSSRLAEMIGVSRQAISKSVKELENLQLLYQEVDPEQANSMVLKLTDNGQRCIALVDQHIQALENRLAEKVGKEAVEQTKKLMSLDWDDLTK